MDKKEQKRFVKNLTTSIAQEIISHIESGNIPENWDGHELRKMIADKANREVTTTMQDARNSRRREYENTVIVSNL